MSKTKLVVLEFGILGICEIVMLNPIKTSKPEQQISQKDDNHKSKRAITYNRGDPLGRQLHMLG
jgi:hypothetical protein